MSFLAFAIVSLSFVLVDSATWASRFHNRFHFLDKNKDGVLNTAELAGAKGTVVYKTRKEYPCMYDAAGSPSFYVGSPKQEICEQGEIDILKECPLNDPNYFSGTATEIDCMLHKPVVGLALPWVLDQVFKKQKAGSPGKKLSDFDPAYRRAHICGSHKGLCAAGENSANGFKWMSERKESHCRAAFQNCRSALRHLVAMMFTDDPATQKCNAFALKSVRGLFHDYVCHFPC